MFSGQSCLEVVSSISGLFRGHIFKVRIVYGSCLQGQDCLEIKSSRLGLFRGIVFKVRLV